METAVTMRPSLVGARVARLEDDRLLTGRGRYIGDLGIPGMVEVAIVRSAVPHARISAIDLTEAHASPGVIAILSGTDLDDVSPFPDFFDYARPVAQRPLARDRVRYIGCPVVAVVATDRYTAEDAAELVVIEYEELPAVSSARGALAPGAATLYDEWPDNRMVDSPASNPAVDEAFARAWRTVSNTVTIQRHAAIPMEARGAVAEFSDGRLTVWSSTQMPHILRTMLSYVLPLRESEIRVIAPDVGGGFGAKAETYAEEALVAWLAVRLERPVGWIEDRAEHMVSTCHARDEAVELEAAIDEKGTILALRGSVLQDMGSGEMVPAGFAPSFILAGSLTGPYRISHQAVSITCVVTNKTPSGAYRGFGVPEAAFAMERLIDRISEDTGIDGLELRRRMLLDSEDLPYESAAGALYDSGSYRSAFEKVVELGRAALEEARSEWGDHSRFRLGLGIANYVEGVVPSYFPTSGHWTAHDSSFVRIEPDGTVVVGVGVSTAGQGLQTMVATVAAEELGVPFDQVRVVMGDTDRAPYGLGGWGSRSTGVASGAIVRAAATVRDKAFRIAGHMLEVDPEDLVADEGRIHVVGIPDRGIAWADLARVAVVRTLDLPPGIEPGLEAFAVFDPQVDHVPRPDGRMNACVTYTNASHAAVVRVDLETGDVRILRYLVAHDCGTVINPMIVEGQIVGGVAQGIGGTLHEDMPYSDRGQPLATTFMDYLVPTASDIPFVDVVHFESPAPGLPFGAKGAGEAGIVGPAPAIAQAVEDALREFGVRGIASTPLSPPVVRRLMAGAGAEAVGARVAQAK
jgi:aerobic carbon-monoxide dehydrogenase large subunit